VAPPHRTVRATLFGEDEQGRFSPLDLGRGVQAPAKPAQGADAEAIVADAG
jgi:hypothetical protein